MLLCPVKLIFLKINYWKNTNYPLAPGGPGLAPPVQGLPVRFKIQTFGQGGIKRELTQTKHQIMTDKKLLHSKRKPEAPTPPSDINQTKMTDKSSTKRKPEAPTPPSNINRTKKMTDKLSTK